MRVYLALGICVSVIAGLIGAWWAEHDSRVYAESERDLTIAVLKAMNDRAERAQLACGPSRGAL